MNARLQFSRVNDPQFGNSKARIKLGLAATVVDEAGVGYLDDQCGGLCSETHVPALLRVEDQVRLKIGVLSQPKRRCDGMEQPVGWARRPFVIQLVLKNFVVEA